MLAGDGVPMIQGTVVDNRIGIQELAGLLWRRRWHVILPSMLLAAAGVTYALLAPVLYRADTTLMLASNRTMLSSSSELGSLASLAGISLAPPESGDAPVAVLRSRAFVRAFVESRNLLPELYSKAWDAERKQWRAPDKAPDIRDAVDRFDREIRAVSEDRRTGLVTVSITWKDPEKAALWANGLVTDVNAFLRARAIANSESNVSFLREQLRTTPVAPLQQAASRVLETELQKLMLARSDEEFAFKVIDPAVAPLKKIKPARTRIVILSTLSGALVGVLIVLMRSRLRSNW